MAATPPAFYGSFRYNLNQYQIGIPLNAGFRFVHEPIHMSTRHELPGLKLPLAPKLGGKRSRNIDLETSLLSYDDKAAEHDVIAISHQTLEANSEHLFGRSAEDVAGTR
jgi:hypothetical protein